MRRHIVTIPVVTAGWQKMPGHITEPNTQSLRYLQREGRLSLPGGMEEKIRIEYARHRSHGHYACNIAMILAGLAGRPPREIAAMIAERLPESRRVEKVEIAGPGFLNFFASDHHFRMVLLAVLEQAND